MSNADKLRKYKLEYGLTNITTAKLLSCSVHIVGKWLLKPDSHYHSPMPDSRLDSLKLRLMDRKKV